MTCLTYTERGWPRPIVNGWPIPWVTPTEELRQTSPERMAEVVDRGLCEVCGIAASPADYVYFLVNLENGPIPENMAEKVVQTMDNAVMHHRCLRLALGRCPALRSLKAKGMLVIYRALWGDVGVYSADDEDVLGVDGDKAERVSWTA